MVVKLSKAEKKVRYDKKLCSLLDEYGKVLIAAADNVGSNQLQSIRRGLRGDSFILMGKNTLIRRCIRFHTEKTGNKDFLNLLPLLVGNVGLIFTKGDLKEVSEEVAKVKYSKDILSYLEDLWLNDECQYNGSMLDVFLAASCFFFSKASNDFWSMHYYYRNLISNGFSLLGFVICSSILGFETGQGLDDPWSNSWLAENAHLFRAVFFCFDLVTVLEKLKRMCSFSSYNQHLMTLDFTSLKYSRVEIDEVRFEWAECMLDYI
ncbi:hypothetical protein ZIOFF_004776 [Zingiber officinale]|uniref:60S acidic ribosomal protein P0 n=1 Tax=Zingiber officinale TaxID=94328 RepID=A0A8J5I0W8_ZINOF|nr:hypothetical protein ZIOFF_004776 [Zingiber officinale]